MLPESLIRLVASGDLTNGCAQFLGHAHIGSRDSERPDMAIALHANIDPSTFPTAILKAGIRLNGDLMSAIGGLLTGCFEAWYWIADVVVSRT